MEELRLHITTGSTGWKQLWKALHTDCGVIMGLFWRLTNDEDVHALSPELPGIVLHRIVGSAICDDQQNFGEASPGAGRLRKTARQDVVESIAWRDQTEKFYSNQHWK